MTLNVSHIQYFSVGDGPGIRTTVFLKGCNLRCPWCHNPETLAEAPQTLCYAQTGMCVSSGRQMTAGDVVDAVLADLAFYAPDGGVTVSGGEPMLQWEGVARLCRLLRQHGIHTIIDTAACVPWAAFDAVLTDTDCFYVDMKTPDAAAYREVIGGDLDLVLSNINRLVASGAHVRARVPIIPGFNDRADACQQMADLLASCGVRAVDLLPFHRLGSGKYRALNLPYAYETVRPPSGEAMRALAAVFAPRFAVRIET